MLLLEIVEPVNLLDVLVLGESLHHHALQLGSVVLACGHGVNAYRHDDAVAQKHLLGNGAGETVDMMGIHRVADANVERTYQYIGAVVVQNDVEHTVNAFEVGYLGLDLMDQILRDSCA